MIPSRVIRFAGFSAFRTIIDRFTRPLSGYMELVSYDDEAWMLSYICNVAPSVHSPKGLQRVSFKVTNAGFEVHSFDVDGDILWDRSHWCFVHKEVQINRKHPQSIIVSKARRSMTTQDYTL